MSYSFYIEVMKEPSTIYHFQMILVTMVHLIAQITPLQIQIVISFKSSLKSDVGMVESHQVFRLSLSKRSETQRARKAQYEYCGSGNYRVFEFSRISDFGTFHEV